MVTLAKAIQATSAFPTTVEGAAESGEIPRANMSIVPWRLTYENASSSYKATLTRTLKQGEHPCALVDCMPVDVDSCDCGLQPTDSCCQGCCEGACASCLVDPCEGITCLDDERYICEANYCEGCNRLWYDENRNRVYCSMESNVTSASLFPQAKNE